MAPTNALTAGKFPGWGGLVWAGALAAVALIYAAWTGHIWEDFFITFRASRNLAEGFGLVFTPGERVHSFTSPLGALIPAWGQMITHHETGALWCLRAVSALALGGAAWYLWLFCQEHALSAMAQAIALMVGLANVKLIDFATNGMETGLLVFFVLLVWRELLRPPGSRPALLAVGYAGLMWTRPDAFILAGAMSAGTLLFAPAGQRHDRWRAIWLGILFGAALYAPWFSWAWWYYGSPIPQTVLAKIVLAPTGMPFLQLAMSPLRLLVDATGIDGLFAPTYFFAGGWPRDLLALCRLFARGAAFLWLFPWLPRWAKIASFSTLCGGIYLHQIYPYPWYLPPWALLAAIAWAGALALPIASSRYAISAGRIVAGLLIGISLCLLLVCAWQNRVQQRLIENGVRREVGLWLSAQASAHDTVFLESLGYIGYFSGLKMLDFPGLSAPEVTRVLANGDHSYASVIATFKPTWLVLRPQEIAQEHLVESPVWRQYRPVYQRSAQSQLDAIRWLPGRAWLESDADFIVLRRL
jgi:hypothetical protein